MLIPSLWWLPCGFSYFPFSHVCQLRKTLFFLWWTMLYPIPGLYRKIESFIWPYVGKNNHLTDGVCQFSSVFCGREWIHATFSYCTTPGHLATWPPQTFLSELELCTKEKYCHFPVQTYQLLLWPSSHCLFYETSGFQLWLPSTWGLKIYGCVSPWP